MRKVILNLAVSLDGYIAGPNGAYDWCFTDADYGMKSFLGAVDTTIMGGKSYRLLLQYGAPYPEFTNHVFTRTETSSSYNNVIFATGDIPGYVKAIQQQDGKYIWLFGGSEIIHPLLEADGIDQLMLSVHPILLGDGLPLFQKLKGRKNFTHTNTISYPSGLVQLYYRR